MRIYTATPRSNLVPYGLVVVTPAFAPTLNAWKIVAYRGSSETHFLLLPSYTTHAPAILLYGRPAGERAPGSQHVYAFLGEVT